MNEAPSPTERAFIVIEMLTMQGSVRFADLVHELGMSKTAAHRLLANLESNRYVQKGARGFQLGPRLYAFSAGILRTALSQASVRAILNRLSLQTGESCGIAILKGGELEYVESVVAGARLTSMFQPGQHAPIHCTSSGRVFLSMMSKQDLEHFYASSPWTRFTPSTVCEAKYLRPIIEQTRRRGFAITGAEFTIGLVGAAVPVYSPERHLLACLNIFAPLARRTEQDIRELMPLLKDAASQITECFRTAPGPKK